MTITKTFLTVPLILAVCMPPAVFAESTSADRQEALAQTLAELRGDDRQTGVGVDPFERGVFAPPAEQPETGVRHRFGRERTPGGQGDR